MTGVAALATSLLATLPHAHVDPSTGAAARPGQPNIVVVMADDMRADELRFLPAVRRLQRSGVTFRRALSADALCCPARATLLTGELAHNHRTIGNRRPTYGGYGVFSQYNDVEHLLPQWLDEQGYRTAWIGKYLNGFGWSRDLTQPDWSYFAVPVRRVYDYWTSRFAINGRRTQRPGYREVYTRRLLLRRIRHWAPDPQPFFVLYSALGPHKQQLGDGSWTAPGVQRAHDHFDTGRLSVRPSVGERVVTDKPAWLRAYAASLPRSKGYPWLWEQRRVEALLSVNDTVHDLVATLRSEHELSRTVVIFTSDNGFMLREHDLLEKNKPYEESVHVPLVVRGPGFRGGGHVSRTVSLADVNAAVRHAAGVVGRHGGDGVPLQEVRAHPRSYARRPVEIEGSVASYPGWRTLLTDRIGRFYTGAVWGPYTLVRYQTGDWEYYDRRRDPWQLHNAYTAHPFPGGHQALLRAWYLTHVDCRGAACNDRVPRG